MTQIANIGPRGQRQRLTLGAIGLVIAVALVAALLGTGAARGWRLVVFVPLWMAGLGIFQARAKT